MSQRGRPKGKTKTYVQFGMESEVHRKLKILAAIEGLTLSEMIGKLIEEREDNEKM